MFRSNLDLKGNANNGVLHFPRAMPFKPLTADGTSFFAMERRKLEGGNDIATTTATTATTTAAAGTNDNNNKKWTNRSDRDASTRMEQRRTNAIVRGTAVAASNDGGGGPQALSFKSSSDPSVAQDARRRMRSQGWNLASISGRRRGTA